MPRGICPVPGVRIRGLEPADRRIGFGFRDLADRGAKEREQPIRPSWEEACGPEPGPVNRRVRAGRGILVGRDPSLALTDISP